MPATPPAIRTAVVQPVDRDVLGLELGETLQQRCGTMDGVDAHPAARRMRAPAQGGHPSSQRPVASALDAGVRRLAEDREVGGEQVGIVAQRTTEAVQLARDLLVVVPDPGEVDRRILQFERERELYGDARLHVDRAATPDDGLTGLRVDLVTHRQVVVDRNGVQMAGDEHAAVPSQPGAGDQRVAVAGHVEVRRRGQQRLDSVRDPSLIPRYRGDVAQLSGQLDWAGRGIECGPGGRSVAHTTTLEA